MKAFPKLKAINSPSHDSTTNSVRLWFSEKITFRPQTFKAICANLWKFMKLTQVVHCCLWHNGIIKITQRDISASYFYCHSCGHSQQLKDFMCFGVVVAEWRAFCCVDHVVISIVISRVFYIFQCGFYIELVIRAIRYLIISNLLQCSLNRKAQSWIYKLWIF